MSSLWGHCQLAQLLTASRSHKETDWSQVDQDQKGTKAILHISSLICSLWTLAKCGWELRNAQISYQLSQSEATFWEDYENTIAKFYWHNLQGACAASVAKGWWFSLWQMWESWKHRGIAAKRAHGIFLAYVSWNTVFLCLLLQWQVNEEKKVEILENKMDICLVAKIKSSAQKPGNPCCYSCSFLNTVTRYISLVKLFIQISTS